MKARHVALEGARYIGAAVAYGALAAFIYLVSLQLYRWFREGEWTHVGTGEGLRAVLARCCVKDGAEGRLAALARWLDAPVDWLGLHKVLEVVPASMTLFALSILANCLFNYCRDRLDEEGARATGGVSPPQT
jgi:hypothetical protein